MVREPRLTTVAIDDLRPTQITVGIREVKEKRKRWRELADAAFRQTEARRGLSPMERGTDAAGRS